MFGKEWPWAIYIKLFILPHGFQIIPQNLTQLLIDLKCVLRALASVHQLGYAHKDVRWPNILCVTDCHWILIDFENADQGNNGLYQEDIRLVGGLIDSWNETNPTQISRAVSSFRDSLISENPPLVLDALNAQPS